MKTVFTLSICFILVVSLSGCGSNINNSNSTPQHEVNSENIQNQANDTTTIESTDKNSSTENNADNPPSESITPSNDKPDVTADKESPIENNADNPQPESETSYSKN